MRGTKRRPRKQPTGNTPTEVRASTHSYIAEWRDKSGLSQERVCEIIGRSDHTLLSKIERGKRPYNQRWLEQLTTVYGCSPAELLGRDPRDPAGMWALCARIIELPPSLRIIVARFIDSVKTEDE